MFSVAIFLSATDICYLAPRDFKVSVNLKKWKMITVVALSVRNSRRNKYEGSGNLNTLKPQEKRGYLYAC